jgi:hypothetical protein
MVGLVRAFLQLFTRAVPGNAGVAPRTLERPARRPGLRYLGALKSVSLMEPN